MKKSLEVLIFLLISGLMLAGTWSDVNQFQKYKFARSVAIEADDAGNTFVAVTNYINASKIAATFSKLEYSLNQMNSAALCLIKVYKQTKDNDLIKQAFDILTEIQNTIEDQNITDVELLKDVNSNMNYCQDHLKK
jgi:hypothetical protein